MLGGGSYAEQNKVLPGAYINFVSAAKAKDRSARGTVAVPMELGWGPEQNIVKVTSDDFRNRCQEVLGYQGTAPQMLPFRELFRNADIAYVYRVNSGGEKASNSHADARYSGRRGNAVRLIIQKNVEDGGEFDVKTAVDAGIVDIQTVAGASELEDNRFVVFKKDVALAETAGMPLSGGTDGSVTGEAYQGFLEAVEQKPFRVLCCPSGDESTGNLFAAYTKRMREEMGIKIQMVGHRIQKADYEGVISVENRAVGHAQGLVYWMAGAAAACALNKSNTNKGYDGEYTVDVAYTQTQLADGIKSGKLMFHQAGDEVRVLRDINTLVTFTEEKGADFCDNQTVRVLDAIGDGVASLFAENFMGKVPNNESGRASLWNGIVTFCKSLAAQQAAEPVDAEQITVEAGGTKRSVSVSVPVQPVNCMDQLYMTVVVE